jgi:hypothetical protein
MWESKDKRGILTFGFTLDEGLDDDNMPFWKTIILWNILNYLKILIMKLNTL